MATKTNIVTVDDLGDSFNVETTIRTYPDQADPTQLTSGAGANIVGNLVSVIAANTLTSNFHIIGVYACLPDTANEYAIYLSAEVAGSAPTGEKVIVPVNAETTVPADTHDYISLAKPVYWDCTEPVCAACSGPAAGKKISVYIVIQTGLAPTKI